LSVKIDPDGPSLGESQWIRSEDINVEHLLDVFTTIDTNSDGVWYACSDFVAHLYWHKKRLTILKPKIEGLPDDHHSKPRCLYELSLLFSGVEDHMEPKRLLIHSLKLSRESGSDHLVATTLIELSEANRLIGLVEEGIPQAKEALEIVERLGDTARQADCLIRLAFLLHSDNQLDAAEEAALRAISLRPEQSEKFRVCESHRILGNISQSKGEVEKTIHHYEEAIRIAAPFNWHEGLFWIHYKLAGLFHDQGRFDDAHAHLEHAKSHTVNSAYFLGLAMEEQAWVLYGQHKFEEAKSEVLRAADAYEKVGAAKEMEGCRRLLQEMEKALNASVASG